MALWQQIRQHLPVEWVGLDAQERFPPTPASPPPASRRYPTVNYKSLSMELLQKPRLNVRVLALVHLPLAPVHESALNCPRSQ